MTQIIDLTDRKVYEIAPPKSGESKIHCPACGSSRRPENRRDRSLQWNEVKGVGQCYAGGCMRAFIKYDPFRAKQPEKQYAIPEWKNKTDLSDKAVKWFEGRMISQKTLRAARVYSDTEFMPQFGKAVEVMCFPYFRGGELVNVKYRGPKKSFKMVSNAELIFYNLDCLKDAKSVIIVEGEIDALSFMEIGCPNVISVPNGASGKDLSYLDTCIDALIGLETVYIATDKDEPGIRLRLELLRRLESTNCKIVDYGECKDANEVLCARGGLGLRSCIDNALDLPVKGDFNLRAHYDEIRMLFENGLSGGHGIGVPVIDEGLTWKTGQLVVWTGLTSHGKSEMVNFCTVRMNIQQGWKAAFFSPENMPYARHLYPKLASLIIGKSFRRGSMTDEEFEQCIDYVNDNFKFIDADDDFTVETIMSTATMMVKRYGIKVLVIDPYNCFEHRHAKGESETLYIGRFLDSLVRFAKRYDVLVHLVAHPPKLAKLNGKREKPDLYDINGSANFANKADIGITIYRRFNDDGTTSCTEFIKRKIRFKEQGAIGELELSYNIINGRYDYAKKKDADGRDVVILDYSNWLNKESSIADVIAPTSFDNDDCPF